eukprot:scaffold349843_cov34-Prasinocladus_malaysianus.AAC.1
MDSNEIAAWAKPISFHIKMERACSIFGSFTRHFNRIGLKMIASVCNKPETETQPAGPYYDR